MHGSSAVQVFWVISGFVFMHVYLEKRTSFTEFFIARFARLYPLHFATLLFVAFLQMFNFNVFGTWQIYGNNDVRHFVLQLFLSTNVVNLSRGLSFNGPIWSVSAEIAAYLMFFLCLFALRHLRIVMSVALVIVCFYLSTASWFDPPVIRATIFKTASYFFFGCSTYFVLLMTGARPVLMVIAASAFSFVSFAGYSIDEKNLFLAGGASSLILIAALMDVVLPKVGRTMRPLGNISYSLYLTHVPLQMLLLTVIDLIKLGDRNLATSYWTMPLYLATSILLAYLIHKYFEAPFGKYIRSKSTS